MAAIEERFHTASGVGSTSGGSQPRCVASHHRKASTTTVTIEMLVVAPSPGIDMPRMRRACVRLSFCTSSGDSGGVAGFGVALIAGFAQCLVVWIRPMHFLAHADELGLRLHRACIAALDELAAERQVVLVHDAPRARAHHDQVGGEEQRFLDRRG